MLKFKFRSHFSHFSIFVLKSIFILTVLLLVQLDSAFSQNEGIEGETTTATEMAAEFTTNAVSETVVFDPVDNSVSFSKKLGSFIEPEYRPQILRKCSAKVKEEFLSVPRKLQAHSAKYQSFRLPHFEEKYGPFIYNFTLVDLNNDLDFGVDPGHKVKIKSPCQDITFDDEEIFNVTTSGESPDLYLQLSFNGGVNPQGEWFVFNPDGFLMRNRGASEIAYNPHNFCVARIDAPYFWIRVCRETCSFDKGWDSKEQKNGGICIPKCCRFGDVRRMSETGEVTCGPVYDKDWSPTPTQFSQGQGQDRDQETFFDFQLNNPVEMGWKCSQSKYVMQKDGLWVLPSGEIYHRDSSRCRNWQLYDPTAVTPDKWMEPTGSPSKLCMEGLWKPKMNTNSNSSVSVTTYDEDDPYDPDDPRAGHLLWFCEHEPEFQNPPFYPIVQFFVYLVASIIHLVTVTAFLSLWSQQNVHGYTTMAFCLGQFFLEFLEFLVRLVIVFHNDDYQKLGTCRLVQLCIAVGALNQFFIITCFSWTTVLCFDIFSKIRSMRAGSKKKGLGRFGLYSIFGCGIPLIWTLVALIIDANTEQMDRVVRPDFSLNCFIDKALPVYVYMTLPISLLALTNLVLTFFTVKFVWESKKQMKSMKDSASSKDDNNVKLIVKLCVMMGVFLLFHVLYSIGNPVVKVSSYLVFLDFYWILQAGATFWIFVWNERTLKQLTSTYPVLAKLTKQSQAVASTASTATTNSYVTSQSQVSTLTATNTVATMGGRSVAVESRAEISQSSDPAM